MPEKRIPLFPLGLVLLPGMPLPLHIFEERYKRMIADCLSEGTVFGIVWFDGRTLRSVGCTARIIRVLHRYEDGRLDILVLGERRFAMEGTIEEKPYLEADVAFIEDAAEEAPDAEALEQARGLLRQLEAAGGEEGGGARPVPALVRHPGHRGVHARRTPAHARDHLGGGAPADLRGRPRPDPRAGAPDAAAQADHRRQRPPPERDDTVPCRHRGRTITGLPIGARITPERKLTADSPYPSPGPSRKGRRMDDCPRCTYRVPGLRCERRPASKGNRGRVPAPTPTAQRSHDPLPLRERAG